MMPDKKGVVLEDKGVFDTEVIYARIVGLLATVTLESILKHELSSIPAALFEDNGDMQIVK